MTERTIYAVVSDGDMHNTVEEAVAARLADVPAHLHPWAHVVEIRIVEGTSVPEVDEDEDDDAVDRQWEAHYRANSPSITGIFQGA